MELPEDFIVGQNLSGSFLHIWFVSECIGGGRAKSKSLSVTNLSLKFIPWGSVAAYQCTYSLNDSMEVGGCLSTSLESYIDLVAHCQASAVHDSKKFLGRAFCFLPLPINTGLPTHINAYFELSSNRRDIWFGNDMAGGGKVRSEWNLYLLEDAIAPAYGRLLVIIAQEVGPCDLFYSFWPTAIGNEPWASMVRKFYVSLSDLGLSVLYTKARGGQWISAKQAIFPDFAFPKVVELAEFLSEAGLPVVNVSNKIVDRFMDSSPSLHFLTPQLLRGLLIRHKRGFKKKDWILIALEYCLSDFKEFSYCDSLFGLPLVPLANGLHTTFSKQGDGERVFVTSNEEYDLLRNSVPYLLVDCNIPYNVLNNLRDLADTEQTNLYKLTCQSLVELFPRILPTEWQYAKQVLWTPGHNDQPTLEWMELFWSYLKASCNDLSIFDKWPILPVKNDFLLPLVENAADATGAGFLNALKAVPFKLQDIKDLFVSASKAEMRELRSFIFQSRWFSGNQMGTMQIEMIKELPIFESYGSEVLLLAEEDDSLKATLVEMPFVLAADGSWKHPSRLYDPRVPGLQDLLNKEAFFPSDKFWISKSVSMLRDMGNVDASQCGWRLLSYLNALGIMLSVSEGEITEKKECVYHSSLTGQPWFTSDENVATPNTTRPKSQMWQSVAFDSPVKYYPYLYAVPSELSEFRALFSQLGVRLTFDAMDYLHVLQGLQHDVNCQPLSTEQLSLHFVHSDINDDLAKRLGVQSLRFLSLVNEKMTRDLPCMDYARISELLALYGESDFLLFDLLELADYIKAKKLHLIYDKRQHPKQSLLQHNLEPAVASGTNRKKDLCSDQDLFLVVTSTSFDPLGLVLGPSSEIGPSTKLFSLIGNDLTERFHDQFYPLLLNQGFSSSTSDSTFIRMPLSSKCMDEHRIGCKRVLQIFERFMCNASSTLLSLKSIFQKGKAVITTVDDAKRWGRTECGPLTPTTFAQPRHGLGVGTKVYHRCFFCLHRKQSEVRPKTEAAAKTSGKFPDRVDRPKKGGAAGREISTGGTVRPATKTDPPRLISLREAQEKELTESRFVHGWWSSKSQTVAGRSPLAQNGQSGAA
ncbi:hypothetical protein HPP92_012908 [Vanilla planifolia]|uniref:Uncharacterized protein n=1 Tax=Vanilla planifolia TaxID=51239 RepID=A0A835QYD7_VANPL|nr:hypothetical protein HPP92_012908 [Vanilla planifolia]